MRRQHQTNRKNPFDVDYVNMTPIYIDENGIEHSLNKNRNWELLEDPNIQQIKYHRDVQTDIHSIAITNKHNHGGGVPRYDYKRPKNYVSVNGQKQNNQFNIYDEKEHIRLPFNKDEYPINRESHQNHGSGCMCCYRSGGRIYELKGTGDKAKKKNKGMKRERMRDTNYGRDFL
ncbi:hypothetical protein Klosneuvirus_2_280 [Klosneuvirus KNV1]|uniref:Uncharacterized protein n=1 Tax=Klosneuvirus KNV1 TaxID=1977640 RepID=A0A1V0SJM2_9VIRU|nr:hypothetical protein Klosneuvirus_2_280 [Klosneuvirus KNV1]